MTVYCYPAGFHYSTVIQIIPVTIYEYPTDYFFAALIVHPAIFCLFPTVLVFFQFLKFLLCFCQLVVIGYKLLLCICQLVIFCSCFLDCFLTVQRYFITNRINFFDNCFCLLFIFLLLFFQFLKFFLCFCQLVVIGYKLLLCICQLVIFCSCFLDCFLTVQRYFITNRINFFDNCFCLLFIFLLLFFQFLKFFLCFCQLVVIGYKLLLCICQLVIFCSCFLDCFLTVQRYFITNRINFFDNCFCLLFIFLLLFFQFLKFFLCFCQLVVIGYKLLLCICQRFICFSCCFNRCLTF